MPSADNGSRTGFTAAQKQDGSYAFFGKSNGVWVEISNAAGAVELPPHSVCVISVRADNLSELLMICSKIGLIIKEENTVGLLIRHLRYIRNISASFLTPPIKFDWYLLRNIVHRCSKNSLNYLTLVL